MAHERRIRSWSSLSRRSFVGALAASVVAPGVRGQAKGGRRLFVSSTGNDGNAGTEQQPFLTIGGVFRRIPDLGPGDMIIVMPGVYEEVVVVTSGGDASGDLILVSQVPHKALIRSPADSYSAVNVVRSFVTVEGFDVQSLGTGHGIEATFLDGDNRNEGPHHITVRNNLCHDSPGSGISVSYGDFYLIENNVCIRNCATNEYQGSGISVYAPRAVEGPEGTRIMVRSNTCHDNTAIKIPGDVPHTDGNGIIIDDLRNTQSGHPAGSYPHVTLVENNLCYRNGGKGVHVFLSEHVTVRNNTCCYNNRDPKNPGVWRAELSNVDSSDCLWVNNIGAADTGVNPSNAAILDASSGKQLNRDVVWKRNLSFAGKPGLQSITQTPPNPSLTPAEPFRNLLGTDPQFVKAGLGEKEPDFGLGPQSPAIDAGSLEEGLAKTDRLGEPRVLGGGPDLGAFERKPS